MDRELRTILITSLILVLAVLLQSTLLQRVAIQGVKPDLALLVLIFASIRKGSMTGQVSGFVSGLVEDALSLSPLGFHAFFRAATGYFYGLTEGNLFVDPIIMPVLLSLIGTVFKGLVSGLLVALFGIPSPGFGRFSGQLWIEAGCNAILAPFVFAGLGMLKVMKQREKEGE